MQVRGLVLAAGAGRRMGGPKALLVDPHSGRALLDLAVSALVEGGCDAVTVVVGAGGERVAEAALAYGASAVACDDWSEGLGASLRAGLAGVSATDDRADAVLVTLVDLPDVGADVVRRVLAAGAGEGREALVRATYAGRPGHPVLLGRAHWDLVAATARGDHGAREHLAVHPHLVVEAGDLATGRDVDTPEDLGRTP